MLMRNNILLYFRTRINDLAEKQYGKFATGDTKANSWTLLDFGRFSSSSLMKLTVCKVIFYCIIYNYKEVILEENNLPVFILIFAILGKWLGFKDYVGNSEVNHSYSSWVFQDSIFGLLYLYICVFGDSLCIKIWLMHSML